MFLVFFICFIHLFWLCAKIHMFSSLWAFSDFSGFLPLLKNISVGVFALGVNECASTCVTPCHGLASYSGCSPTLHLVYPG